MIRRERTFDGRASRGKYDMKVLSSGYATVVTTTDCGLYGQWANPTTRTIVSFVEGDVCRTKYETEKAFADELRRMAEWHGTEEWRGISTRDDRMLEAFTKLGVSDLLIASRRERAATPAAEEHPRETGTHASRPAGWRPPENTRERDQLAGP